MSDRDPYVCRQQIQSKEADRDESKHERSRRSSPFFMSPAFTSVVAQLIAQHLIESNERPDQAERWLCGRWLALRRLERRLSNAQVVAQTDVSAETLILLEQGHADETMASEQAWEQLCMILAGTTGDVDWVAIVVNTTLGRRPVNDAVMARIGAELQAKEQQ